MKLSALFFFLASFLHCVDLAGTWKLKSEPMKPFNFASIVGYEATFKFNDKGTLVHVGKEGNLLGSERFYNLNGNRLNIYLKNPNQGTINNFALGLLSSTDYELKPIKPNCYEVIDLKRGSHPFLMCKER